MGFATEIGYFTERVTCVTPVGKLFGNGIRGGFIIVCKESEVMKTK